MNITIEKPDLADYQKEILYNEARFTITEASTKVGKTFSHLFWIFERAHEPWNEAGFNHWWIAPIYSTAEIAFNRLKLIVQQSGLYKINETKLSITTPLGSVIRFKTAKDHNALFGEDVYSIVFDEAPRAKFEAFTALRSTITFTGGQMKMIGNFGGVSNWMHLLKEKALTDPKYFYKRITAWDAVKAGILKSEEIEQAQKDLPPKVFAALYLAEAQEEDDQLCSNDAIKDLWTNKHVEEGRRYITADIALHGSDRFIILVWSGWRIIHFVEIDKIEADEVEKVLKDLADKFSVGRSHIAYDADGLGSFLRGYLRGAKPFNNGAPPIDRNTRTKINYKNLKSQCGYEIAKKVNDSEIFIDCDLPKSDFIRELECLRSYDLDSDGKIQLLPKKKIKELLGVSPDWLDAFLMRMFFDLKPISKAPRRAHIIQQ